MIICSSFINVAVLHSLLANVSTPQSQGWGTMSAVVRRRPPWFIVCFLGMCCVLCVVYIRYVNWDKSQFLPLVASTCNEHDAIVATCTEVDHMFPQQEL